MEMVTLYCNCLDVTHSFNKRQEDFGDDLKAYNNYLEEFEDLSQSSVFNSGFAIQIH